jgi:hypothetical protein
MLRIKAYNNIGGGSSPRIAMPGYPGLVRLVAGKNKSLLVKYKKDTFPCRWASVTPESLWRIAEIDTLSDSHRRGAALACIARKHYGYARSYLKGLDMGDSKNLFVMEQAIASREGRYIVDWFDFSSYSQINRWKAVGGIWNIERGRLSASGDGAFVMLKGRFFSLKNFSLRFMFKRTKGDGNLFVNFDDMRKGSLSIMFSQNETSLSYTPNDEGGEIQQAQSVSGPAFGGEGLVVFSVKDGKAEIKNGKENVLDIDVPDLSELISPLRLRLTGLEATFDNVVVEEGR